MTQPERPNRTALTVTVICSAVLAVCGLLMLLINLGSREAFPITFGAVMLLAGLIAFIANFRVWRRS